MRAVAGCVDQAAAIKREISPVEFYRVELGISLDRPGWQAANCCCPFHSDTRPGSFKIHAGTGAFKCFSCNASGADIIDFAEMRYGLDFRQTVAALCEAWGIRP